MKHIQLFEDFKQGLMKKPQGLFSRITQGAKHAMGMENKEDRKALESIYFALSRFPLDDNFRELKPGVLLAGVMDRNILVDVNTPEISYQGRELDLHNLKDEAKSLYDKLMSMKKN
jgi:hypothetical protein